MPLRGPPRNRLPRNPQGQGSGCKPAATKPAATKPAAHKTGRHEAGRHETGRHETGFHETSCRKASRRETGRREARKANGHGCQAGRREARRAEGCREAGRSAEAEDCDRQAGRPVKAKAATAKPLPSNPKAAAAPANERAGAAAKPAPPTRIRLAQQPSSAPEPAASDGFRPDLEGLRGIAVLLVPLFHAGVPGIPGGYIGVDVFFVLSGFLITGLLVRELERTGTVSLSGFYARRFAASPAGRGARVSS